MKANSYDNPGDAGGNLEEIGGELSLLQPTETPFFSMVKKGTCFSTTPEVGADELRKPRTTGTKEGKGSTRTGNKAAGRKRFAGRVHRSFDEWAVSDVQADVAKAGGNAFTGNEKDYAITQTMLAIKTDFEATCLGSQEGAGGSDDEMRARGYFKWVYASAQADSPVPSAFRTPSASIISLSLGSSEVLSESTTSGMYKSFNALLKSMKGVYGRKIDVKCFAGDDLIEQVDNFTRASGGVTGRYRVQEGEFNHEISLSVTVFDTSFARVEMIPDQFVDLNETTGIGNTRSAAVAVMDSWEVQFLEELVNKELEDDGSGPNGWLRAKFATLCRNPKGQGAILGVA